MTILTSAPISALAIALLTRSLVLPRTVSRVPGGEFSGPSGGTVTLRVPQPRTAKEQETPASTIELAEVEEVPVTVTVHHLYDATRLSDEDLTLEIESFGRQVLRPQVAAVATGAEDVLAEAMNGLDPDTEIEWLDPDDPDDTRATVLAARQRLTTNDTPAGDRWLAVAPDIATRILAVPEYVRLDASGERSALRDAIIGRLYGLTVVESNALDAGTAAAYHSSGFAFGSLAPAPASGADSSTVTEDGVSLRHVIAFDATRLASISAVSTFAGATAVADNDDGDEFPRVVKIGSAAS